MIQVDGMCMNCMGNLHVQNPVCPRCGFDNAAYQNAVHQLECGSILAGAYLVGRVLGQGGFGITYVGWDLNLEMRVAIKEYYPEGCVTRDAHTHVSVLSLAGEREAMFQKGRERFVDEAKTLAKFSGESSIVGVRSFFFENGTAYIVMDYVEGETLKAYAARRGGSIPATELLPLMRPLMRSLARVHETGLLHRDISPDNIMLRRDGTLTLLDFGAARQMSMDGEHSNTINVKHGFAPEEQYRTRGEQGPWTDVYALAATIYRLVTGRMPPQALDRLLNDDALIAPSALGVELPAAQEAALLNGLAIRAFQRTRSMQELESQLFAADSSDKPSSMVASRETSAPVAGTAGMNDRPEKDTPSVPAICDAASKSESDYAVTAAATESAAGESSLAAEAKAEEPSTDHSADDGSRKKSGHKQLALLFGTVVFFALIVALIHRSNVNTNTELLAAFVESKDFSNAANLIVSLDNQMGEYDPALYECAEKLLESGEYDLASSAIAAIANPGSYAVGDLNRKIAYNKVDALFKKQEYQAAIDLINKIDIDNHAVATSLIRKHTRSIYEYAAELYRSNQTAKSKKVFSMIGDYSRVNDYLFLIEISRKANTDQLHWELGGGLFDEAVQTEVEQLIDIAGFENSGDILMKTSDTAFLFLQGQWWGETTSLKFFYSNDGMQASWDITGIPSGTWRFGNGDFYLTNSKGDETKTAQFTVVDRDTITVYVYASERTYTLKRA